MCVGICICFDFLNGCVVGVGREAQEFAMEVLGMPAREFWACMYVSILSCGWACFGMYACTYLLYIVCGKHMNLLWRCWGCLHACVRACVRACVCVGIYMF